MQPIFFGGCGGRSFCTAFGAAYDPRNTGGGGGTVLPFPPTGVPASIAVRSAVNIGDELAKGGVYVLRNRVTGDVVRTGRTTDLLRRQTEHFRNRVTRDYRFEPVARTDVYAEQRGLEQLLHNVYKPPLNKINPVSTSNPNKLWYEIAANRFLAKYGGM